MDRLVRVAGRTSADDVEVADGLVLGRGEGAGLRLFDETASRRHAVLHRTPQGVILEDLGSANGTRVNGGLAKRVMLRDGDEIVVGEVRLRFLSATGAERPTVVRKESGSSAPSAKTPAAPRRGPRAEAPEILGRSSAVRRLVEATDRAAATEATVLVRGETGSGKELIALRLHALGSRGSGPFVAVNCAAIVEGLLESEMFGHERGAFTGAEARREGRFAQAAGGTLFLDEVGELSPALQAKLLRALSDRTYTRVGGTEVLRVTCRIVAATHRDLPAFVSAGRFREDLWYRLAVVTLDVPPLRDRGDDVDLLAEAILARTAARLGRPVPLIDADARARLRSHRWPGNVRELENALERALVLASGASLSVADLALDAPDKSTPVTGPESLSLREAEKRAIAAALARTNGRKGEAAALLGISWPTLNRKIREYRLDD
jgi:two-component system response regulator AtoC